MASTNDNITLYRIEDHIDISIGPMIADLGQIGRANISAVHEIESSIGHMYRFQGVALPQELKISHYAYQVISKRASNLNYSSIPS